MPGTASSARRLNVATRPTKRSSDNRSWMLKGLCRKLDPDALFVTGTAQRKAADTICCHCPVKRECGIDALDNQVEFGVWGGMTERQRKALLVLNPNVASWADVIATANDH